MTEISFGHYQCRSCGKWYIVNEPGKWLCSPGVCHDCYPAFNSAAEFARYCLEQPDSTPAMIALCQIVIRMMDEPLPTTVTEELRTPEPQGTFACSVCGLDTPHWHDVDVVNRERVIERVVRPAFEKAYTELARAFPDIRVSGWVGGFQRRQEKDAPDPPLNPSLIAGWYSRWPDDSFAPLVGEYKNPIIQALWRLWLRARESSVLSPLERRTGPVGWVVALEAFGENTYRVYGPQYRTREAAEQDADLPRKRGQKAQVWECHLPADPRPPMPEGCVGGCPPQQVCDHCQWPTSGKDEQSTPQSHTSTKEA